MIWVSYSLEYLIQELSRLWNSLSAIFDFCFLVQKSLVLFFCVTRFNTSEWNEFQLFGVNKLSFFFLMICMILKGLCILDILSMFEFLSLLHIFVKYDYILYILCCGRDMLTGANPPSRCIRDDVVRSHQLWT